MGVTTLFILPDFPQTAKFLTERERSTIIDRLSKDAPSKEGKTWDNGEVLRLLADPTFWTFSAVWFCHAVGGFGLSYVLPTVIYELGTCFVIQRRLRIIEIRRRIYNDSIEQRPLHASVTERVCIVEHPGMAHSKALLEPFPDSYGTCVSVLMSRCSRLIARW